MLNMEKNFIFNFESSNSGKFPKNRAVRFYSSHQVFERYTDIQAMVFGPGVCQRTRTNLKSMGPDSGRQGMQGTLIIKAYQVPFIINVPGIPGPTNTRLEQLVP